MKGYVRLFESPDSVQRHGMRLRYYDGFAFLWNERGFALGRFGVTHVTMLKEMHNAGKDMSWIAGWDPDKLPYPFDIDVIYEKNVVGRAWPDHRIVSFWRESGKIAWNEDGVLTKGHGVVVSVLSSLPRSEGWPADPAEWYFDAWYEANLLDKLVPIGKALGRGGSERGGYEGASRRFLSNAGD
jgi:hypothetical protein